ncbi:MAG TPA: CPBP family intramembrane glutamic endopeptidase [Chloroflexota bacterium]|jgi:hypothetical protein|nr:CPBP family intramembrane glutamic endopeptidase [Chloroflexota bacterium]
MTREPGRAVAPDPPAAWRREWEERVRRAAPEQLTFDHGRATRYWSSREHAGQSAVLESFGHWPVVTLDTILVFVAEVVLNLVLAAVAIFVIATNGPPLGHRSTAYNALQHASTVVSQQWLVSPVGIACSALVTQAGIMLILYLRVVRRGVLSWSDLGFGPVLRREPLRALALGIGFGLLAFVVGEALLSIMNAAGLDVQEQQKSFQSVRHTSPAELAPFFITTVLTAPLAEEAFFRGYALRALTVRYGLPIGLVVSSALFAVLHLGGAVGWVVVPLFVVGLVLGWAYARTGNLITSITAHAINNLIGVLLLYGSR